MKKNPIMTMIVPGRRSLGESWSKVTVTPNPDTGKYDVEREDTTAPANNTAIFVPALGNLSVEAADYILEYKRKDQEYRKARKLPARERWTHEDINKMFHEWIDFKSRHLQGKTVSGPGGWTQRERIGHGK